VLGACGVAAVDGTLPTDRDGGAISDGGATPVDAPNSVPGCEAFEPNDRFETARSIADGAMHELAICPGGDIDVFRFFVPEDYDLIITLTFDGSVADLDRDLFDSANRQIEETNGVGNVEKIERYGLEPGEYYLGVFAFAATSEAPYSLSLRIPPS